MSVQAPAAGDVSQSPSGGDGDSTVIIIVLVVIVVVLVVLMIIVAAVVILKKKNAVATPSPSGKKVGLEEVQVHVSQKKLGPEELARLKELKELLDNGVLDQAEFDAQKKAMLADV